MNRVIRIATKITKMICADDATYIYDPDHEKKPSGGYHKTEKGWSKVDTSDKENEDSKIIPETRRKETQKIVSELFTDEEKKKEPKMNSKYNTEESFYLKATESQQLMEEKLDKGNEESWLGEGASRCGFSEAEIMEPGPKLIVAPIKSVKRAKEKVDNDFGGDWGKLRDGVRCSVAVDRIEDLPNALEGLRKSGCKISAPPKNRFEERLKSGYGDCLLNVDFGNGFVGEVQFHLKSMLVAKEFRGGHKLYESERTIYSKYEPDTPIEKYEPQDQEMISDLLHEQSKIYNRAYNRGIMAGRKVKMKYILSNNKYSYYKYGEWDAPAFCCGNNFPQFWNGKEWKVVNSFLKFADNAVEISKEEFIKRLKKAGISFDEK